MKEFPLLSFRKRFSYSLPAEIADIASIAEIAKIGTIETSPYGLRKAIVWL